MRRGEARPLRRGVPGSGVSPVGAAGAAEPVSRGHVSPARPSASRLLHPLITGAGPPETGPPAPLQVGARVGRLRSDPRRRVASQSRTRQWQPDPALRWVAGPPPRPGCRACGLQHGSPVPGDPGRGTQGDGAVPRAFEKQERGGRVDRLRAVACWAARGHVLGCARSRVSTSTGHARWWLPVKGEYAKPSTPNFGGPGGDTGDSHLRSAPHFSWI